MKIKEGAGSARGYVSPSFVDLSTGRSVPFDMRHNMLSYMSAEAMAAAFGGDPSYIPARMGFIYGDKSNPDMSPITRAQDWTGVIEEIESAGGDATLDVQIVGFSYLPTLGGSNPAPTDSSDSSDSSDPGDSGSDTSEGDYNHILPGGSNAITFHAVSNSLDSGWLGKRPFHNGDYIYHAVLLGYHKGDYYVISRVTLENNGTYLRKPDGFEVALDWTVAFN